MYFQTGKPPPARNPPTFSRHLFPNGPSLQQRARMSPKNPVAAESPIFLATIMGIMGDRMWLMLIMMHLPSSPSTALTTLTPIKISLFITLASAPLPSSWVTARLTMRYPAPSSNCRACMRVVNCRALRTRGGLVSARTTLVTDLPKGPSFVRSSDSTSRSLRPRLILLYSCTLSLSSSSSTTARGLMSTTPSALTVGRSDP
mmetsp:Transcript_33901/g.69215  ORF Transcript_33901/g.69215 Transcript_33901/m.69215 type:complete len:202 (+) Transcript_33901:181-786(+)